LPRVTTRDNRCAQLMPKLLNPSRQSRLCRIVGIRCTGVLLLARERDKAGEWAGIQGLFLEHRL
jgi:hypothetical protein